MMKTLLTIIFGFTVLIVNAQAPNYLWAKKSSTVSAISVSNIAVDASGNSYITGHFSGPVTFGGTLLYNGSTGGTFIVKYNPSGTVVWAKSAVGAGSVYSSAIAVDSNGNVYVAGRFDAPTITFGVLTLNNSSTSSPTYDGFVLKLDSAGNFAWGTRIFSSNTGDDAVSAIAINNSTVNNGYVYATGYYYDTVTQSRNFVVQRVSPAGSLGWGFDTGGTGSDLGQGITLDPAGNIYVTGSFSSASISFGGITLNKTGSSNMFVFKYDVDVNAVAWAKSSSGTGSCSSEGVVVDAAGNSYMTGSFNGASATFGSTILTNPVAGSYTNYLVKYDTNGTVVWAKSPNGGNTGYYSGSIAVDTDSNCYIMGGFDTSSVVLGSTTLTNVGGADLFFAKYNQNGTVVWAKAIGGNGSDFSGTIALNSAGNMFVAGSFLSDSLTFGATTLTNQGNETWDSEIFLARLDNAVLADVDFAAANDAIKVFPNPATTEITIATKNQTGISAITITDLNGRIVKQNSFENIPSVQVNITDLSRGIYMAKIISDEKTTIKKFIKN